MTFSILAFDRTTRELGSAVASCSVAVGGTVAYSRMGVGVVHTQHHAHLGVGQAVLDAMERGVHPQEALARVLGGTCGAEELQLIAIDVEDRKGAWTGADCTPPRGHLVGDSCVVAGNMLAGEEVVRRMANAFEAGRGASLGRRLLASLEAGEVAGGDARGRQSAAVKVLPPRGVTIDVNLDLRVDDARDPLRELRRIYSVFLRELRRG